MTAHSGAGRLCPQCHGRYDEGTFFCVKCGVRLQAADAPARRATLPRDLAAAPQPGRPHILMVEDSELFISLTVEQLEDNAIDVTVARTGAEALQLAKYVRPTMVLMDVELPDGSGDDFATQLSEHYGADTPVYLYSSLSDAALATRARRSGCSGFISKQRGVHAMIFNVKRILVKLGAL